MDKLKMQTKDYTEENARKLMELFPNIVTESIDINGNVVRAIDKDKLEQEINATVVAGPKQRYEFTWPDKKQAQITARTPINKTLRPCREESVNFDTTENLYIEGDNLEVLKLLQETYLGKIKMIYIDPPYNTGHDFVYDDDFAQNVDEYKENSGLYDEEGNFIATDANLDSNGRFHTDWLNMMYPRLRLAKNLLTDDGVIFISIDDNEVRNLRNICDEIFGEQNFIASFIWQKKSSGGEHANYVLDFHEYVLVYARQISNVGKILVNRTDEQLSSFTLEDEYVESRGKYLLSPLKSWLDYRRTLIYDIECPDGTFVNTQWVCGKDTFLKLKEEGRIVFKKSPKNGWSVYKKQYSNENGGLVKPASIIIGHGQTANGKRQIKILFDGKDVMSFPKPVELVEYLVSMLCDDKSIYLDFFSGSATTAHAIMQLNAEDGGKRKFIMVQLPEKCDEKSEAFKAGYKNICEIGKERIRRAGKKIVEGLTPQSAAPIAPLTGGTGSEQTASPLASQSGEGDRKAVEGLDIGFRVFKVDSSNMKDGFYLTPDKLQQESLDIFEENVKEDRSGEDLLFQGMLELGFLPSNKVVTIDIRGKKVFSVSSNEGDEGYLIACFEENLTEDIITEIAKLNPCYFVTRNKSIASDSTLSNFEQIFKTYDALYDKDRTIKMIGMR